MRLLIKEFYTLAELQAAWNMPDQDIQYLIATSRLKLSIVVYSQTLVTVPPGPHLPTDAKRRVYSGMLDLNPSDAVAILRQGEAPIACFSMPDGQAGHFASVRARGVISGVGDGVFRGGACPTPECGIAGGHRAHRYGGVCTLQP